MRSDGARPTSIKLYLADGRADGLRLVEKLRAHWPLTLGLLSERHTASMPASSPRAHRDPAFLSAKQARFEEHHVAPVQALVRRIREFSGDPAVPYVDPDSGGLEPMGRPQHSKYCAGLDYPAHAWGPNQRDPRQFQRRELDIAVPARVS